MLQLSRPRRPHRLGEWTSDKVVTFIVTLAVSQSVTLAARSAGLSRKSAYALRARDPAFAGAWNAAVKARSARRQGNKTEEVREPPVSRGQRDKRTRVRRSISSTAHPDARGLDSIWRDRFFTRLAERIGESANLAHRSSAQ